MKVDEATVSRFWAKVVKTNNCWLWTAGQSVDGYARFSIDKPKHTSFAAHRVAYELLVGPIPDGLSLDHLCRNILCVNPEHLEPVTIKENILRGTSLSARNARKSRCMHGHSLSGANLYMTKCGKRQCRACRRRIQNNWNAGRRAEKP